MLGKVEAVICNRYFEQALHGVVHGDGPRLTIVQEVVVKGDLALLRSTDEPIASTAFQVVLYTNGVIDVENDVLGKLDEEMLCRIATLNRDPEHP